MTIVVILYDIHIQEFVVSTKVAILHQLVWYVDFIFYSVCMCMCARARLCVRVCVQEYKLHSRDSEPLYQVE